MTHETTNKKAFAYLRKSLKPEDKQAATLPKQRRLIEAFAKENGITIVKWFEESGSGWIDGDKRPKFEAMVEEIKSRDDIDSIVSFDTDRLSRNDQDNGIIKKLIIRENIKEVLTTQGEVYNTNNLESLAIKQVFGFAYSHRISKNVNSSIADRHLQGIPHYIVTGYEWDPKAKKGTKKPIETPYLLLMRKILEQFMTSQHSVKGVKDMADGMGIKNTQGRSISTSAMLQILKTPYYTGRFQDSKDKTKTIPNQGSYKTILTDEEHELILKILTGKSRPRKQKNNFALNGLMKCDCGLLVYGDKKVRPNGKEYLLYGHDKKRNNCKQGWVNENDIRPQVEEYLSKIEMDPDFVKWSFKWLRKLNESEVETRESARKSVQASYDNTVRSLDNLIKLKLEMGDSFSTDEFRKTHQDLLYQKQVSKDNLDKIDKRIDEWQELTLKTFIFCETAPQRFKNGTVEDKKFVMRMVDSNCVLKDRNISIIGRKPFRKIAEQIENRNVYSNTFLQTKETDYSASNESLLSGSFVVRDRRDSNARPSP